MVTKKQFLESLEANNGRVNSVAREFSLSNTLANQMLICWSIYPNKIKEIMQEGDTEKLDDMIKIHKDFLRKNKRKYSGVNWEDDETWKPSVPEKPFEETGTVSPSPIQPPVESEKGTIEVTKEHYEKLEKEKQELLELVRHERESAYTELKKLEEDVNKKQQIITEQQLNLAKMEIKMKDMMPIPKPKELVSPKGKKRGSDIILPRIYPRILALAKARINIVMVGPTGCGKTTIAEQLAKDLKLPFGFISLSSGISEGQLGGRIFPSFKNDLIYFTSELVKFVEEGGVFLFDEMDAADNNTFLWCNSLFSNKRCSVPNRVKKPYAIKHKDFIGIGAMNTFGNGADRMFVGRNQLDEATLDRFRIGLVEMDYDEDVEKAIVREDILEWGLRIRNKIREYQMRKSMSTRFLKDLTIMAEKNPEFFGRQEDWLETFTKGWKEDEKRKII